MFWTVVLLALLVALGGFLAYYGDLQGRRWGKKRVSWFGMRPKHTAILITILTGSTISLISILVLFVVSAPVREVILHGEHAIRENRRLRKQRVMQEERLKEIESRNVNANQNLLQTSGELEDTEKRLRAQKAVLYQTLQRLHGLNVQVAQLQKQEQRLRGEQAVLFAANRRISTQTSLYSTKYHLLALKNQKTRSQLEKDRKQLVALNRVYGIALGTGRVLGSSYLAIRQGRIAVRRGAELGRAVVPAHSSIADVMSVLNAMLNRAGSYVMRYGAAAGANNSAVRIVPKNIQTTSGMKTLGEQDILNALAANLSNSVSDNFVIVSAFSNSIQGEQTPADLSAYPVKPAFRAGEILAAARLDGSQPASVLAQKIADFLQNQVRSAALQAGIVPRVNPVTGVGEIGTFGPFALVQLADKAAAMGGILQLRAVATAPISTADLLNSQNLQLVCVKNVPGIADAPTH